MLLDAGKPIRFRCHTGHAFTLKTLQTALAETVNPAMWTAVRALQEKGFSLETLIAGHREAGERTPRLNTLNRFVKLT